MPLTGILVDEVSEAVNIAAGEIEDTPDFGDGVSPPYILSMAKGKGKVKILLGIDGMLQAQELEGLKSMLQ